MKKISILIFSILLFACNPQENSDTAERTRGENETFLPKALFITTGLNFNTEDADLPQSVLIAIQSFNKRGIPVRLEPRDVLYNDKFMSNYDIIILSTATGCHDSDRKHSLTYMTDNELYNIRKFVKNGGVIIAGDNIGRNYFDGTDRIVEINEMNSFNYPLSDMFGVTLIEKNEIGFKIEGKLENVFEDILMKSSEEDLWTLVPNKIISKDLKILAEWKNDTITLPAITQNKFGKGMAFLLFSSDFLDTKGENINSSVSQINNFYDYVIDQYFETNKLNISMNPWPNGHNTAFCVTFNPLGKIEDYKNIYKKCKKLEVEPTFFVNGILSDTIRDFLKNTTTNLASNGFSYESYRGVNYPVAVEDILLNENVWSEKFEGFRFPFTSPELSGILALDLHNYSYESSISVNNIEFVHGSVFPYNIVLATNDFYKSTNLLEISATYHDDYFFLSKILENKYQSPNQLNKDVLLYEQYLQDFWQNAVKPYNGLMVFLGHPGIVGLNDTTFTALSKIIQTTNKDNAWITTIEEVADYRKKLELFRLSVEIKKNKTIVYTKAPQGIYIENFTINCKKEPKSVSAKKGKANIIPTENQEYKIIFDAFDGQEININW